MSILSFLLYIECNNFKKNLAIISCALCQFILYKHVIFQKLSRMKNNRKLKLNSSCVHMGMLSIV